MERSDAFTTVLNHLTKQHQEFLDRAAANLGFALRKENQTLRSERDALLKEVLQLRSGSAKGKFPLFADKPDVFDLENAPSMMPDSINEEPQPLNAPAPPNDCEPPQVDLPPPPSQARGEAVLFDSESEPEFLRSDGPKRRDGMPQAQMRNSLTAGLDTRVKAAYQEAEQASFDRPSGVLARVVFNSRFESLALALVLCNTVAIAVQTDYQARYDLAKPPWVFIFVEVLFFCFYTTEVVIRVTADWRAFFQGPGNGMNIFDCCLIIVQFGEIGAALVVMNSDTSVNLTFLRCLRLTRAVRFNRSVHLLDIFKEIRACCVAMMMSLKPFVAACIMLTMWITIISVYYTDRALSRRLWLGMEHEDVPSIRAAYGTLYRSSYSLFMAISGGLDWKELSTLLPSVPDTILFVTYISFSLLVLLNIITGVVISNVMKTAKDDEMACILPSAEKVLRHVAPHDGHFRRDISTCLASAGMRLMVTGLQREHAGGNGEYVHLGEHNGRPLFIQQKEGWDAYVVYFSDKCQWCLGPSVSGEVAVRRTETVNPPRGRWPVNTLMDSYCITVKHVVCKKRKELKALFRMMEIDEADVEAIFALCEPSPGGDVSMQSFLSMYLEARSPARRLELMQMSQDFGKS